MSDSEKKWALVIVGVVFLIWLFLRKKNTNQIISTPPQNTDSQFYAPYYWPGGIYPEAVNFSPNISVSAELPAWARLSREYMPTFGLVGMVGVKA